MSQMAIAIEDGDYKTATELARELSKIDFSRFSLNERKKLQMEISNLIEKAKKQELEIAETISKKLKARKFVQ
ncbi:MULTISPECIES: hypothetical protein [unclassified Desulfurobacterium]|uniref:hypothetical protein n=1 Tax=Desulfurobacterium sp. TC5-1 TaxID=1158318 RepID=UPI0003B60B71|nr:hypothetical protein [Desulfurobacterium sp. TC5-1]